MANGTPIVIDNVWKYLPVTPRDKAWGCQVTSAGSHTVPPSYTSFSDVSGRQLWGKGRVLPDYAALYLTRGRGVFQSKESGRIEVKEGDLILLFPNLWHRYRPDPKVGWDEQWIVFNGMQPDRMCEHGLIQPSSPVIHVGVGGHVADLYAEILSQIQSHRLPPNRIIASMALQILAHSVSVVGNPDGSSNAESDVAVVRHYLEQHVCSPVEMRDLAAMVNRSYCSLQRLFKRDTGITPHQYHMHLRILRAKELLENPNLSVKEVSAKLGFDDAYYFSRLFKNNTGYSPKDWRNSVSRRVPDAGALPHTPPETLSLDSARKLSSLDP